MSDPTEDVKVATENLLADFLREIREIAKVQQQRDEAIRVSKWKQQQQQQQALYRQGSKGTLDNDVDGGKEKSITEKGAFIPEGDEKESMLDGESIVLREGIGGVGEEGHDRDTGGKSCLSPLQKADIVLMPDEAWVPGQAVVVDHAAIVEILIQQLDPSRKHTFAHLYISLRRSISSTQMTKSNSRPLCDGLPSSSTLSNPSWFHLHLGLSLPYCPISPTTSQQCNRLRYKRTRISLE